MRQDNPGDGMGGALAAALVELNAQVAPFHEFLAGQRAYFNSQGYTDDEARAMAAAEFVTVFGSSISRTIADGRS
jgi:hypothetical protein